MPAFILMKNPAGTGRVFFIFAGRFILFVLSGELLRAGL
jgi:hypothetical protein